ncbi:hypothetical protein [Kaistia granuli]|uniref:hypothetical protein n=1 Tax=Kaistia granuli TaxID=363259 RepID=UPI00037F5250|nr:hypothetical protein [Kaistia granuli]
MILCAVLLGGAQAAQADEMAERRRALLLLSLSPEEFEGKPVAVRCPIFSAAVGDFSCAVVNSKIETVGSLYVNSDELPSDTKIELVERCTNRSVGPDCVANLLVTIKNGIPMAQSLEWVPGSTPTD